MLGPIKLEYTIKRVLLGVFGDNVLLAETFCGLTGYNIYRRVLYLTAPRSANAVLRQLKCRSQNRETMMSFIALQI
jgi:hypothetical protein